MKQNAFWKNYGFVLSMFVGIAAGCVTGIVWKDAAVLEPLGTLFVNLMFCVVVPLVFFSISGAIANLGSMKRAGRLLGGTVLTFLVTAAIASVLMYAVMRLLNGPLFRSLAAYQGEGVADSLTAADVPTLIINFFTKPDFTELFSRRAILPLIVAAVLFGFGVQMAGGAETMTARLLADINRCIMNVVRIITYYAPIAFFGFFACLVSTYGKDFLTGYGMTLIVYYALSFAYMFVFAPVYARFGGGREAVRVLWKHLAKPAAVSFGTCSSVATIPTNLQAAEESGIRRDVADVVIPLGATMHMDGSAMGAILKVAFLFAFFGKDFTSGQAVLAIIVAVFSSVAMSGIPGGGGTGDLVLCSLFFPDQLAVAYPISIALANLIDPPATMVNAAMDYVATFIVSRLTEGKDWMKKRGGRE